MPSRSLPNLGLQAFFDLGEDGWNDEMDLNMLRLSVLTQAGAIDKVSALPVSPSDGDVYILDQNVLGQANNIAIRDAGNWVYIEPQEGWLIYNRGMNRYETFDGVQWAVLQTGTSNGGGNNGGGSGASVPYSGAMVGRLATTVLSTIGAWTPFVWDEEKLDTDGFWTPANPSRLTIPAGVTKIRLVAAFQIDASDTVSSHQFTFSKNGNINFSGTVRWNFGGGGYSNPACVGVSPVLNVVAGDYFEVSYFTNETFAINAISLFSIEVVERTASSTGLNLSLDQLLDVNAIAPNGGNALLFDDVSGNWIAGTPTVNINATQGLNKPFLGVMARFTSNSLSSTSPVTITWQATEYDTSNFWTVASPSRLTIPVGSGITKIRLSATLTPTTTDMGTDHLVATFLKNGSGNFVGNAHVGYEIGYTDVGVSLVSGIVPVQEGDYFEVWFNSPDTSRTWDANRSAFSLEVLELNEALQPSPITLDGIADVDLTTTAPTDGQALIYDEATDTWVPGNVVSNSSGGNASTPSYPYAPRLANFTQVNITAPATVVDIDRGIVISSPRGPNNNLRMLTVPITSAPWVLTTKLTVVGLRREFLCAGAVLGNVALDDWRTVRNFAGNDSFGFGWGFGTHFGLADIANNQTVGTTSLTPDDSFWLRLTDNGTNRICEISSDGVYWVEVVREASNLFTADVVGVVFSNRISSDPSNVAPASLAHMIVEYFEYCPANQVTPIIANQLQRGGAAAGNVDSVIAKNLQTRPPRASSFPNLIGSPVVSQVTNALTIEGALASTQVRAILKPVTQSGSFTVITRVKAALLSNFNHASIVFTDGTRYVTVGSIYVNGNFAEITGFTNANTFNTGFGFVAFTANPPPEWFRADANPTTGVVTGYYSWDGEKWFLLGSSTAGYLTSITQYGLGVVNRNNISACNASFTYYEDGTADDGIEVSSFGGGEKLWMLQWSPLENEPPATNYASLDTRNSRPVLDFDATTQEAAVFTGVMPFDYSGRGVVVTIYCALSTATSGTLGWDVAIERNQIGVDSAATDSFSAAHTVTAMAVPSTAGVILAMSVSINDGAAMDNLAAGEMFRLRIRRDVANDTAAGDAEILRVVMRGL